jgi:hypothetical protein
MVTPLPVAGSSLYTSSDGTYSIRYPSNWQLQTDAPFFIVLPPDVGSTRFDSFGELDFPHINKSEYVSDLTSLLGSDATSTNIQVAIESIAVTVGKYSWVTIKASYYDTSLKLVSNYSAGVVL